MIALGIDVSHRLQEQWTEWLAPTVQPFFVGPSEKCLAPWVEDRTMTPGLGHTYRTWSVARDLDVRWLDERTFFDLPRSVRAALARSQARVRRGAVPAVRRWASTAGGQALSSAGDGRRFVWWPSMVAEAGGDVLPFVISGSPDGAAAPAHPSRHDEIGRAAWEEAASLVPGAEDLAGTFANGSGPNCFATVLGAAGVPRVRDECIVEAPFLHWLADNTRPGGRDGDPGTVLVWRDDRGAPVHTAVTIGGGWALEKASAEWWTPRAVRAVPDVIRAARAVGQRLERHRIAG